MNLWELSSLGIEFAFIFVGSVLLGNFLDEKFNTGPWGLMIFAALGFAFGIYYIVYRANKLDLTGEQSHKEKIRNKK